MQTVCGQSSTGGSIDALDLYTERELLRVAPQSIVDFGAGQGKYGELVRKILHHPVHVTAVEAFEPTAEELRKRALYDVVECARMEEWCLRQTKRYNLAIFGDVLEHVPRRVAQRVVRNALKIFDHIILNVPLENVYQDAIGGNPYEIHRGYLVESDFDAWPSREKHVVTVDEGYRKMNLWIQSTRMTSLQWIKYRMKHLLLRVFERRLKHLRASRSSGI